MTTSPADTLICDTAQIALWQSDAEYDYDRDLMTPEINILEWIMNQIDRLLDHVFDSRFVDEYSPLILVSIAVVILLLLIWLVYTKQPKLFMRSRKNNLPYCIEEDTIYGVDFESGIKDSISNSDYRKAVRLLYLQTLKMLSDEGKIDWQLYKTPTEYVYEVHSTSFRNLTNQFMRVRYGNFEATEATFRIMVGLQGEIMKGAAV